MAMTPEVKAERAKARKVLRKAHKEAIKEEQSRNQREVKQIIISIEWRNSKQWESNPHAQAVVEYKYRKRGENIHEIRKGYTASGCGYDKESTVVASIFNDFLKYELYCNIKGDKPYGICISNSFRYYDEGIGISCYYPISKYIGGMFEHVSGGKMFDVYKYTDKKIKEN